MKPKVLLYLLVGVVVGVMGLEVTREREAIQYGYTPIEGEAVFVEFSEDAYMSDDLYCLPLLEALPPLTCLPCVYNNADACPSHLDLSQFSAETQQDLLTLSPCSCFTSACQFKELTQGVTIEVPVTEKSSIVYRYEHNSFDEGFVVKKKAITNFSPTITVAMAPTFDLPEIMATSDYDNILICPSHPLFGPKSNTITYFISIQSERATSIHISIENLPFRGDLGVPENFTTPNASIIYYTPTQTPEEGSYVRAEGDYFRREFGVPFSPVAPFLILYPISECGTYSLRTEVLDYGEPDLWVPQIYLGVINETEKGFLGKLSGGISGCDSCFGVSDFLQLESTTHWVSQDSVLSFCPETTEENNYILLLIYTSPYPWLADFYFEKAERSPFLSSYPLSDPSWSYIQVQERLRDIWTLRLPCFESETCLPTSNPFNFLVRENLMTPNYFPSILYPANEVERIDMVPEVAYQTKEAYFLRCQDRNLDSGCGLLSSLKGGAYATPIVYPAAEPLYSLNPLPTLEAQDLSYLFPYKANSISLFTVAEIQFQTIISSERYEGATISFSNPNRLHTKELEAIELEEFRLSDISQKDKTSCNFDTFNPLYELYVYLHEVLQDSQSGVSPDSTKNYLGITPQTANFWAYTLAWSSEFQSCWQNVLALHSFKNEETVVGNTTACTNPNDLSDPCCNPNLGWSDCCSAENREVLQIQSLPFEINSQFNDENCADPNCMETLAGDFREIYQNSLADQICLVNDEISSNISGFFQFCTSRYIGEQPDFGVFCKANSECDFLGDPDGYCDLKAKKCIVGTEYQENAFLQCLINQMGGFTATLIYQELVNEGVADPDEYNEGDEFLTPDLLRKYAVDGENRCFGDYGPAEERHQYFALQAQPTQRDSTCPICDETTGLPIRCLTTFSCITPVQCEDITTSCVSNFVSKTPVCEEPTSDDYVCNWNSSIVDRVECEVEEFRCLYCFNSTYCVDLPATTREECESTPLCVLHDGEVLWDVSEEECAGRETCTEGAVDNEDDCLVGGTCKDPDSISKAIEALLPVFPLLAPALNGVCITPLNPYNTPACPLLRPDEIVSLDFSTQRGCVRLGRCFFNFRSGEFLCVHDPSTEEECNTLFDGEWLPLPLSNQQDCENSRGVPEEDSPGFCRLNYKDQYLSPQIRSECEECGGEPVPPAQWEPYYWEAGTPVKATWREAKMEPLYEVSTSTISYFKLEDLFKQAALNYQTFILWSGESCLINPFIRYINIVACDCPAGELPTNEGENPFFGFTLDNKDCFTETDTGVIGTIWFCPNSDFTIGVISGVVTSKSEYVTGELCFFSELTLASIASFVGNQPSEPVTVTNDPNELDPSPVRNQKGASVGTVLGNGVTFQLSENVQPVDWDDAVGAVQLTFTIDRSVFQEKDIPDWYIIDFGLEVVDPNLKTQPSDEIELQPVNAKNGASVGLTVRELLENDEGSIEIDGLMPEPFRYNKAARIYPIARLPDWENENKDEALSTGEQAMTGVFAGLYGIAFFATILILIKGLHSLTLSLLVLFLYVLATFSFRTAFWAIVASGDYEETSAGYYILIEPPSFFILSVLTVLIMSFAFIVAASKNGADKLGTYWLVWLILQIFLIAVLFVVVGLMIGLDNNDDITISCFGRESSVEENTTIRDIRIAYHSFILFVAILCLIYVIKLGRDLPDEENKSTLQILSVLAGLAVVLTSLLWVIYSAIDETTPYFVIPLFLTEVPPLLLMCYLAFPSTVQYEAQEVDL